jgi:hypothetical protein
VLAVVIPRSTFLKDLISPIHHASSKAAIKTGTPPHLASKQELQFETVESHVSFPSATILGKLLLGHVYHASVFFWYIVLLSSNGIKDCGNVFLCSKRMGLHGRLKNT